VQIDVILSRPGTWPRRIANSTATRRVTLTTWRLGWLSLCSAVLVIAFVAVLVVTLVLAVRMFGRVLFRVRRSGGSEAEHSGGGGNGGDGLAHVVWSFRVKSVPGEQVPSDHDLFVVARRANRIKALLRVTPHSKPNGSCLS